MAEPVSKPPTPAPGDKPASQPVAGVSPANAPATPAVTPSAKETAPKFGGLRGGKKREDGLVPGSEKAIQADKEADAKRKRDERAAKREADPAALPAAGAGVGANAGGQAMPWDAGMLKPLFDQIIPTAERLSIKQITSLAEKAKLPGEIIHEIEKDAAWNECAKTALQISAPQVAAKWLNKSGVSAEHQPEVVLGTAVASIIGGQFLLIRRMKELIAAANPPPTKTVTDQAKPSVTQPGVTDQEKKP